MIKVFEVGSKLNVIDDTNNLVGFDTDDACCAHGGWFISPEKITTDLENHDMKAPKEYPDYSFDTSFFDEVKDADIDDGGLVLFKMIADGKPDLYLHLYNSHNGYYSKGFEASFGEIKDKSDNYL